MDRPSALGAFSYEVIDTKLARYVKPETVQTVAAVTATPALQATSLSPSLALAGTPYPVPERALSSGSAADLIALARLG